MQLQDFYDYKNQLMKEILTSEKLVTLIQHDATLETAPQLAYSQVFPYEYVPETVQKGQTFVCFDVDVQRTFNKTYLQPTIFIWVFTHRSNMRLPEGGVRVDKICSEICNMINGSYVYSLGQLEFSSSKRFAPMTDYQGKLLTFTGKEFNRQYDATRPIPNNRKNP